MAKKDFTKKINDNPTLNFITVTGDKNEPQGVTPHAEEIKPPQASENIPENLHLLDELKTKRLNLVLQPTIYKLAQQKAKATGTSTNNFIINAIIDALQGDDEQ